MGSSDDIDADVRFGSWIKRGCMVIFNMMKRHECLHTLRRRTRITAFFDNSRRASDPAGSDRHECACTLLGCSEILVRKDEEGCPITLLVDLME